MTFVSYVKELIQRMFHLGASIILMGGGLFAFAYSMILYAQGVRGAPIYFTSIIGFVSVIAAVVLGGYYRHKYPSRRHYAPHQSRSNTVVVDTVNDRIKRQNEGFEKVFGESPLVKDFTNRKKRK